MILNSNESLQIQLNLSVTRSGGESSRACPKVQAGALFYPQ